MVEFGRDLDVCTRGEMLERWTGHQRRAIEGLLDGDIETLVPATHNPIYRMATRYWFDNDPSLLYAPLHRDRLCASYLEHYFAPVNAYAGLIVLMQRESFKSTFGHGVFPQWLSVRERHLNGRDLRIALIHHREQQAVANAARLKQVSLSHPMFKKYWPEFSAEKDFGTSAAFDWPCKTTRGFAEPSILATGLGARLVGLHFDWMGYSDPVTDEHIESKQVREQALLKYEASRFMLDTLVGKEVIDGTRYHIHDLHGKNLRAKVNGRDAYKRLVVGAGTTEETLTFPTRHSLEFLERRRQEYIARTGNDFLWWLQYQNEPKASNMIVADWEWLRECRLSEVPGEAWRVILCDPAWKGTKNAGEGDDAAIEVWAVERRGSVLLKYWMDGTYSNMMSGEDGKAEIFRFMRKYGVIDVAPEERGGYSFKTSLMNDAASRGVMINVIDLKTSGLGKNTRISTFLGTCQRGEVFLCDSLPQSVRAKFRSQYEDFPQTEHDDVLDCAAYICDSAIEEGYSPIFNSGANAHKAPWWAERPKGRENRTRYGML